MFKCGGARRRLCDRHPVSGRLGLDATYIEQRVEPALTRLVLQSECCAHVLSS